MHNRLLGAALSALLLCAVACTEAAPDPGPRFDDEKAGGAVRELDCMRHQPQRPGARYTDAELQSTGETLALLRYYTANGAKPYCDGKGPTGVDREWADIYVRLGADRDNVATLLDDEG